MWGVYRIDQIYKFQFLITSKLPAECFPNFDKLYGQCRRWFLQEIFFVWRFVYQKSSSLSLLKIYSLGRYYSIILTQRYGVTLHLSSLWKKLGLFWFENLSIIVSFCLVQADKNHTNWRKSYQSSNYEIITNSLWWFKLFSSSETAVKRRKYWENEIIRNRCNRTS
jgi:hypothetical protein